MYKVMIVDDRDIVRTELKRLKIWGEASGFVISDEAQNGQEALDKLELSPADLVITDIKMPKVDGIELLRAIVERNLCSCVVLLSDFSDFQYARQGIILGAFDYIPKPVNAAELSDLLTRARKLLDQERQEKERIKRLEDAQKDMVLRLPADELSTLISLIRMGDEASLQEIEQRMIRALENAKSNEHIRMAGILKHAIDAITADLVNSYPNIELFITSIDDRMFDELKDCTDQMRLFMDKAKDLSRLVKMLRFEAQDKGIVKQVCAFIFSNLENNISLSMAADRLYMNKTYISESFKQKMGISFTEYVTLVKMERAKAYILKDELKTYEVAEKLGFKDAEYFSRLFKKVTGLSPTEFHQKHTGK